MPEITIRLRDDGTIEVRGFEEAWAWAQARGKHLGLRVTLGEETTWADEPAFISEILS